ncbi:gluconate 2-dehydrogenase subunit 3 family protein [uncultured Amphritea sp.]|uniref:gluconate 2-dehydrogenase subunit 3 family protein n=1 Tax=uncultured Amphritea sp. TaxID=981605 RepID=UPI0026168862|nr:gluconate 2-dehydrogenase subunit 3 family protein [uncultured Amphritea sp.]
MNKNKKDLSPSVGAAKGKADEVCMNRRRFLSKTGTYAVAASAVVISGGLFAPDSYAAKKIGDKANITLLKMARDIYPHDTLEDKYYTQVLTPMITAAATDDTKLSELSGGAKSLDQIASQQFGVSYIDIKSEQERVVVLKQIESSPFFQNIKGALMMGIYNNPDLWPRFGFGGSAWEKGGYINRGYNDIDWI